MTEFLSSLRADLTDRRMRVVVILVAVALIGALVYALSGGSSSTPTSAPSSPLGGSAPSIAAVAAPPNPNESVAETASGAPHQHSGASRNPFTPLPGSPSPLAASASAKSSSSSSSSTASSTSTKTAAAGSGSSSGGHQVALKPLLVKQQFLIHFHTTVQFGVVPAPPAPGAPPPAPQLKTYKDIKLHEALPSKENSQLVYLGVVLRTGKAAVFELTGEVFLHGSAKCLPSPKHCIAIELHIGHSATLESIEPNGTPVTYQIKLLSISRSVTSASSARVHTGSVG
jgi:hypothetical protein